MHGNTPHAGRVTEEPTTEARKALRRNIEAITSSTRSLLPDTFVVGAEIVDGADGLQATVAVQPPAGSVVSAGFTFDEDADEVELARELAAGAALEAKHANEDVPQIAK
ncbi:hypothetical protein GJ631_14550 [Natronomonas sp. CBA1123]|jgi:hypothetical protein|uniref:DUF5811 family protein n=1 Tax=Natronomonas sp. CBA1123 TaxID=2668070 RepID=UPI0012E9CEA5|nr:DUF5811 family protein [Natronomonas sp. CBA1123]MUV87739.1 hypothetical protein [Natronomonas sp. CBA1123]